MERLTVEIKRGEKFYIAQCLEHSNCFAQGETIEETIKNIKEVICLILDAPQPRIRVDLLDELVEAL